MNKKLVEKWYDKEWQKDYGALIIQHIAASLIFPRSSVLDVGCGNGRFLALLRPKKCKLSGVDISKTAIEKCSLLGADAKRCDLTHETIPFHNASFDYITILDVLEHLDDPISALRKLRPKFRKGGKLIVSVPNALWLGYRAFHLLGKPIHRWVDSSDSTSYGEGIHEPTHIRYFDVHSLELVLKLAGFRISEFHSVGKLPKLKAFEFKSKRFQNLLAQTIIVVAEIN